MPTRVNGVILEAFIALTDPEIYTNSDSPAWLIFYDIGPSGASMTTSGSGDARHEAAVMFGGKRDD